jgi:hypothetical protein
MSSSVKGVRGGTLGSGKSLCRTCRWATIIQGAAASETIVYCKEISYDKPIPFEAYECNEYDDKRLASKVEMESLAWILRTDPKQKGHLGFVSPKQRREELGDNWDTPSVFKDEGRCR